MASWTIQSAEDIKMLHGLYGPAVSEHSLKLIRKMLYDPEFDPMPFVVEALAHMVDVVSENHPLRVAADEYQRRRR
jgi:hypothetical protein